jgi:hypothetical protein
MNNLFGSFYNKEDRYQQKTIIPKPLKKRKEKKQNLYLGFKNKNVCYCCWEKSKNPKSNKKTET